jgi:hypothetical protein
VAPLELAPQAETARTLAASIPIVLLLILE